MAFNWSYSNTEDDGRKMGVDREMVAMLNHSEAELPKLRFLS